MEFEDQVEQEDAIGLPPSYDSLGNSCRPKMTSPVGNDAPPPRKPRYRECLKNHAVAIGGQAVDGCGEFMAAGAEGTLDGLKCAACNCHRNFHRKETGGEALNFPHHLLTHHPHPQQFSPYYRTTPSGYLHVAPHQRPLALPSASGGGGGGGGGSQEQEEEDMSNPSMGRKRHRTKFSQEQKDKMLGLAERLEWRIQKQDEEVVQQFCNETGVKRQVLKVWMHNNKHTLGKKP